MGLSDEGLGTRNRIGHIRTFQDATDKAGKETPDLFPFFATVKNTYSDRMTCDLMVESTGEVFKNVPLMTQAGLDSTNKVYGEIDLPQVGAIVVVDFVGPYVRQKVIVGTIIPYLFSHFQGSQTPVNSSSKAYTLKLLEKNKPNTYRKIFNSGTTMEVGEDGTLIIETPSGSLVLVDEGNKVVKVYDKMNGNTILMDNTGIKLTDKNSNNITMGSGKVTINGNLEIDQ